MTQSWDLLIGGGTRIDPARAISARRDVAFAGGKVATVEERLAGEAREVIDASGALVTPAARRFRTRHVIEDGRRLPAAHADHL
jgi:predicted amidohydrolase